MVHAARGSVKTEVCAPLCRTAGRFDRSTVQLAQLFATQAGALLGLSEQVERLSEGLHTRTDVGTSVGIVMGGDDHRVGAIVWSRFDNFAGHLEPR